MPHLFHSRKTAEHADPEAESLPAEYRLASWIFGYKVVLPIAPTGIVPTTSIVNPTLIVPQPITNYLENGGRLKGAQQMAGHESSRTTGLCDRRGDEISLDEVERISY